MAEYVVVEGRVGRHEGPHQALKIYVVGDTVEMTEAEAAGHGSRVRLKAQAEATSGPPPPVAVAVAGPTVAGTVGQSEPAPVARAEQEPTPTTPRRGKRKTPATRAK